MVSGQQMRWITYDRRSFDRKEKDVAGGRNHHLSLLLFSMNLSRLFHCSVIKVLCSLSLRQLLYFIKSICLCQQLFYFSLLSFQATACLSYHRRSALSTTFFLAVFQQLSYIIMYSSACQQLFSFFITVSGEGGI